MSIIHSLTKDREPTNYLDIANASFDNSGELLNSATILFKHKKQALGLFLLLTSLEEIQKAIFCLFVYKGWTSSKLISPIFSEHEVKTILFYEIFSDDGFAVVGNTGYLGGQKINEINLKKLVDKHRHEASQHKSLREGCLYINKYGLRDAFPKNLNKLNQKKEKIFKEINALVGIFHAVKGMRVATQVNNFHFYVKKGVSTIQYDEI